MNIFYCHIISLFIHLNSYFSKFITLILSWLMGGVKIGTGCVFYGLPYFRTSLKGIIIIGNHCVFRSTKRSNLLGLNHQCIISTGSPNYDTLVEIGDECGFSGVTIRCFTHIKIGNRVRIGANSMIIDGDEHFDDYRSSPPKEIIIEDNVFIGANCIIRKGVKIGKNSVIGMNSMVLHNIPENSVAVGTPAKVIRSVFL